MLQTVYFYNFFHNGDIFLSKEFVRWIINNIPAERYIYSHKNSSKLLLDIDNLGINNNLPNQPIDHSWLLRDNCLYINTWCRTHQGKYHDATGYTFLTFYNVFANELKSTLNVHLPDQLTKFIPKIDYARFKIRHAKTFLDNHHNADKKSIFISNCKVMSGQSINFDFDDIIDTLARRYSDAIFFVSDESCVQQYNVFHTRDIINIDENDLNENCYISKHCDLIIGRSSGTYTFAINTDVLESNTKLIGLTKHPTYTHFGLNKYWPQKFVHSSNFDSNHIVKTISNVIENLF